MMSIAYFNIQGLYAYVSFNVTQINIQIHTGTIGQPKGRVYRKKWSHKRNRYLSFFVKLNFFILDTMVCRVVTFNIITLIPLHV